MATERQQIEDQAAAFLQRRDTGDWTEADEAEFSAWIESSTAHRVVYLRTEAAWEAMGRLKALGAGLPPKQVPSPEVISAAASPNLADRAPEHSSVESRKAIRSRSYKPAAVAASLVAAVGLVLWGYPVWFRGERYATPTGGLASVPLEDGSHIILNTASQIRVVLSATERHVDLTQGEAFFEVAKDPKRPFVVQAQHTRIIAMGTQFSVRREGEDQVQVLVTEGKVRIAGPAPPSAATDAAPSSQAPSTASAQTTFLTAGEVGHVGRDGVMVRDEPASQAEEALAWRDGYLVFRNTSLADAVAEFNRYSVRQIVVEDPAVAKIPLTGKFRATNSDAFIHLLEQTFSIQAQDVSGKVILSRTDLR